MRQYCRIVFSLFQMCDAPCSFSGSALVKSSLSPIHSQFWVLTSFGVMVEKAR